MDSRIVLDHKRNLAAEMTKVFGIGLSRTGGRSLHFALKRLGYRSKHWGFLLVKCDLSLRYDRLEKYDALLDLPAVLNYKELDKKYPDAKFILTLRDKRSWLDSMKRLHNFQRWFVAFLPNVLKMDKKIWGQVSYDKKNLSRRYDAYVNEVREHFKGREDKLLELNVTKGEGYEKLCPFLGLLVLEESFPHANKGIAKKIIKKVQK